MLDKDTISQINNFVAEKPRTIQEIAQLLGRNWRTADSYVDRIASELGTIAVRTFKKGTRGAIKVVYWNMISQNDSSFQDILFKKIITLTDKKDFSPFDIYQYIDDNKREAFLEDQEKNLNIKQDLIGTLISAEKQVLIFSGDFSWGNAKQGDEPLMNIFESLARNEINVKILADVNINSIKNIQKASEINYKYGKEVIEIRHCQQPLRAFVVDNSLAQFKEKHFIKKDSVDNYIFYSVTDSIWVNWAQRLFWHFFSSSISAEKRIKDLKSIIGLEETVINKRKKNKELSVFLKKCRR